MIVLVFITLIRENVVGQEKRELNHEIGINTLQLLATTLDLTYDRTYKPWYSLSMNTGYTFNYSYSFDLPGFFLSPHCKCGNSGYTMKNQSGGFLKAGLKFNLRRTLEKKNYFFVGSFITNSLVYESAEYENWELPDSPAEELNHTVFIVGLTGVVGYNFKLSNKVSSDFGVHISRASNKYKDLYGYKNYIPGMGYYEHTDYAKSNLFPMVVLNLKYTLNE